MHLIYIDESKDQNNYFVYCALVIHENKWKAALRSFQEYRRQLKKDHGIYVNKEMHAGEFCAGKGQVSYRVILKPERAAIFKATLKFFTTVNGLRLFSSANQVEQYAFERLVNRINRTMAERNSNAILICDEGNEAEFRRRIRRLGVFNPIPSNRGVWDDSGSRTKNLTLDRIIEDPIFKPSHDSYFIQAVDFCAYALLRMDRPIPSKTKYGLNNAFPILEPICIKVANRKDKFGTIR